MPPLPMPPMLPPPELWGYRHPLDYEMRWGRPPPPEFLPRGLPPPPDFHMMVSIQI